MQKDKLFSRRAWVAVVACGVMTLTGASAVFAAPVTVKPVPGTPFPVAPRVIPAVPVPIDDFTSGPHTLTTTAPSDTSGQSGSMAGMARCIILDASLNPYVRPSTVSVGGGHLFVETGVGVGHAVTLLYGVDQQCANNPMDLNLSALDRFRIEFDLLDLPLAGSMVVWSPSGISSVPICMTGVAPGTGFVCDMPFSDFTGEADFQHIQYIAIVLESAGSILSHDYGIKSITAVLDANAPAGQHPSAVQTPTRLQPHTTPALIRGGR